MRAKRRDSVVAAGEQLPLPGEPAASSASTESTQAESSRCGSTSCEAHGDALSGFATVLWLLSVDRVHPLDWPGVVFSVEEAARHYELWRAGEL